MFSQANTAVVGLIVAILIVVFGGLGFRYARNRGEQVIDETSLGIIQAAAFTLVGLLLAFSFSLGLSRYDSRRGVTLKEGNAIGRLLLRTQLLDPPFRKTMQQYMAAYATARLSFAASGIDVAGQQRAVRVSNNLQDRMWSLVMVAAAHDRRSTVMPLLIQSLNDTIDASVEQAASLNAHVPDEVLAILIVVMLIAAGLLGFSLGKSGHKAYLPTTMLAIILALVVCAILDLDRPQRGFIRVDLTPLAQVQRAAQAAIR